MTKVKTRVIEFIKANGWELDMQSYGSDEEFWTYNKDGCLSIDLSKTEMVFLDDTGDFLHADMNLYTMIGILMCYRQLPFNFKQP